MVKILGKIPCFVPSRLTWGASQGVEHNTCLEGKQLPAVSLASLYNLFCGSLLAVVLVFTLVWLNLVEPAAIFIMLP